MRRATIGFAKRKLQSGICNESCVLDECNREAFRFFKINPFRELLKSESMELKKVEKLDDIMVGDTLIITGDTLKNEPVKVEMIKVTEKDGTEVIFDKKNNRFFNLGMYLNGQSWVKEVGVII